MSLTKVSYSMITGSPVNIFDFIPAAEHAAITAGTSTYDCYSAIVAAIASFPDPNGNVFYSQAGTLMFPLGKYYCSDTIQVERAVNFVGANAAIAGGTVSATLIEFEQNKTGFSVQRYNTGSSGKGGDSTSFQNLTIVQKSGSTIGDGVRARARILISNCTFFYWGGNGILITATAGGGASEGNANCFRVENSVSSFNVGNGFKTDGGDANAGTIVGLDASNNGGYGIWDSSFLGNTYIGCHCSSNLTGAYYVDTNNNARNVFVGCYSEGGQTNDFRSTNTLILGGLYFEGMTATTTAKLFIDGLTRVGANQLLGGADSSTAKWELRYDGLNTSEYFRISTAAGGGGSRKPGVEMADEFFNSQGGRVSPYVASTRAGLDAELVTGATNVNQGRTRFVVKGGDTNGFEVDFSSDRGTTYANYLNLDGSGNFFSGFDNTKTLGSAAKRWSVVYAGTGAINTSDDRAKQQRTGGIDPAVLRAWGKVEYAQYKFNDAVAQKGEGARWHFGLIAQRVKEAFESEGLDAFKYGLLCYDQWDDEYGTQIVEKTVVDENGDEILVGEIIKTDEVIRPKGDRYGIRYEEALALECAYLRSKLN